MVKQKDIEEFYEFIHTEAKKRFPQHCDDDGHSRIQIVLVDLDTYFYLPYVPIKRSYTAWNASTSDNVDGLRYAGINLHIAQRDVDRAHQNLISKQADDKLC